MSPGDQLKRSVRTAVIYGIRNIRNGKYYVGSTRDVSIRWASHRTLLESNAHTAKLQAAWNESSATDWSWEILEEQIPLIHQFESEQHWIDSLDAYDNGYNTSPRAGSYVSIDSRGYDTFIRQRQDDILEMLVQIELGTPYRRVASAFGVSVGFVGNLKKNFPDLLAKRIQADEADKQRVAFRQQALEHRKATRKARDNTIIDLVRQGISYREVAKRAGCSVGTVGNVVARATRRANGQ